MHCNEANHSAFSCYLRQWMIGTNKIKIYKKLATLSKTIFFKVFLYAQNIFQLTVHRNTQNQSHSVVDNDRNQQIQFLVTCVTQPFIFNRIIIVLRRQLEKIT